MAIGAVTIIGTTSQNTAAGKTAVIEIPFDAVAYAAGGEVLNLQAAPFTLENLFTTVRSVSIDEFYSTAAPPAVLALTIAANVKYLPAAAHAPATGRIYVEVEDAAGVTAQAGAISLATMIVRATVTGT